MDLEQYAGPNWTLSDEYDGLNSQEFLNDENFVKISLEQISKLEEELKEYLPNINKLIQENYTKVLNLAVSMFKLAEKTDIILSNLYTYINCYLSTDTLNSTYKQALGRILELDNKFLVSTTALNIFIINAPQKLIDMYLTDEDVKYSTFKVYNKRRIKPYSLSYAEENLINKLSNNGFDAWDILYTNTTGTLKCELILNSKKEEISITKAFALMHDTNEEIRKNAFIAYRETFRKNKDLFAHILNSIFGWKQSVAEKRSYNQNYHYLEKSIVNNHIQKETLNAMLQACTEQKEVAQKVYQIMAKALKKDKLDPWDHFAPAPVTSQTSIRFSFNEGISLITEAFNRIDPQMGDFVQIMLKNGWIEAGQNGNRRMGAYCTDFAKSKSPRVYCTYNGDVSSLTTLAHELGHAFHHWIIKDLPYSQQHYPMNLAETASIFAETVLTDMLIERLGNTPEVLPIVWEEAANVATFMLNIPARFDLECKICEAKLNSQTLTKDILDNLMIESFNYRYGNTFNEFDESFWASKLHFYKTNVSFYNWPYTFGYLFSAGIYAMRTKLGLNFYDAYVNLLKDTGKESTEILVQKYLGEDTTKLDFWLNAIIFASNKVKKLAEITS